LLSCCLASGYSASAGVVNQPLHKAYLTGFYSSFLL
jgi:hypothetical protein